MTKTLPPLVKKAVSIYVVLYLLYVALAGLDLPLIPDEQSSVAQRIGFRIFPHVKWDMFRRPQAKDIRMEVVATFPGGETSSWDLSHAPQLGLDRVGKYKLEHWTEYIWQPTHPLRKRDAVRFFARILSREGARPESISLVMHAKDIPPFADQTWQIPRDQMKVTRSRVAWKYPVEGAP